MTVTLYNELDGSPSINGTWTHTGSGPAAPGTYNGVIDFTGFPNGDYVYTYEVTLAACVHTADVTVTVGEQDPPLNDTCAGARHIVTPGSGDYTLFGETNLGSCPGIDPPTDSGVAIPAAWGAGPFSGDLWYFFVTVPPDPNNITIEITGAPYGTSGVTNPMMAIYTGTCGALVEDSATTASPGSQMVNGSITNDGTTTITYFVRMVTPSGDEGEFDVKLTVN